MNLLKTMLVDTVYLNVMKVESESIGPEYLLCNDIDEYIKFEQHRLNVVHRVTQEDLSIENREYGHVLQLKLLYMTIS